MPKGKRQRLVRARAAQLGGDDGTSTAAQAVANPFAAQKNARAKHDVMNRRIRGGERNMVVARSKAETRRQQTLLQEYKQHGKANVFQDRRFGERVADMSHEEKMLQRLVKARTKQARKKSVFNLNDEEGDTTTVLTRFGRALGDSSYRDVQVDDDFGDDLEADIVNNLHFGGGDMPDWRGKAPLPAWMKNRDDNPNRPRTHKEVMQEVIAKAKFHKAQRAKEKREQEEMLDQLDDSLDVVRALLGDTRKSRGKPNKDEARKSYKDMLASGQVDEAKDAAVEAQDDADEEGFSYDRAVREISQEARTARPTDRLKTDAEVAQEELERLQALEEKRVARMKMEVSGSAGPTDDDLVGNYEVDTTMFDDGNSSGDDSLASFDSARDSGMDAVSSDEEAGDMAQDEGGDDDDGVVVVEDVSHMPYLVDCPKNVTAWQALITKYGGSPTTVAELVRRIRTRYSGHLSAANEPTLAKLYRILLEYVTTLRGGAKDVVARAVSIVDMLLPSLYEMSQKNTAARAAAWKAVLSSIHHRVSKRLAVGSQRSPWLTLGDVLLLRMATHVYPPTDYRHPVLTPATLLLGRVIMQCPLRSAADVAAGLACCAALIEMTTEAGRVSPEVLTFLHGLLCAVSHPSKAEQASDAVSLPAFLTSHGFTHVAWLRDGVSKWRAALAQLVDSNPGDTSSSNVPLMTFHLVDASQDTAATPSECAGVKLLQRAAECVSGVDACPEILYPAWLACGLVLPLAPQTKKRRRKNKKSKKSKKQNEPAFHDPLTRVIEDTVAGLNTLMNQASNDRSVLQLQEDVRKPKAITTYDPLFEDGYQPSANPMPTDPKAQLRKLQREVRREQKGVARELRKDAQFVARVRDEEFSKRDAEREAKTKEIMSFLEQQQATFNQMVKAGVTKGGGSNLPITKADRRKRKRGL